MLKFMIILNFLNTVMEKQLTMARDIRLGRLSREDGIELAECVDQKPNNLDIFLDWPILAKMNSTIKLIN